MVSMVGVSAIEIGMTRRLKPTRPGARAEVTFENQKQNDPKPLQMPLDSWQLRLGFLNSSHGTPAICFWGHAHTNAKTCISL